VKILTRELGALMILALVGAVLLDATPTPPPSPPAQTAMLRRQKGVLEVAFSADGRTLASVDLSGTVALHDPATGAERCRFQEQPSMARSVALTSDGKVLAIALLQGGVRLLATDFADGAFACELGDGGHRTVAFSPDGTLLAAANVRDKTVTLWNWRKKQITLSLRGDLGCANVLRFSPDGRRLVSGWSDGWIRIWEIPSGRECASFRAHHRGVLSVAFAPDGRSFATAGMYERIVRLWSSTDGRATGSLPAHEDGVGSVSISPDGALMATTGFAPPIRLWDVATGRERATLRGHSPALTSVVFSPNGRLLASAGLDGTGRLWDVAKALDLGPSLDPTKTAVAGDAL